MKKTSSLKRLSVLFVMLLLCVMLPFQVFAAPTDTPNNEVQVGTEPGVLPGDGNNGTIPDTNSGTGNNGKTTSNNGSGIDEQKQQEVVDGLFSDSGLNIDFNKGKEQLAPLNRVISTILSLLIGLLLMILPITFIADILVAFIPATKKLFEFGKGDKAGFKLTSNHVSILEGQGNGEKGNKWVAYLKARMIELIFAFVVMALVFSNTHMVVIQFVVSAIIQGVNYIISFCKELLAGLA